MVNPTQSRAHAGVEFIDNKQRHEGERLTDASTLAGEEKFGSDNRETTLNITVPGVWVGSQRSSGRSPLISSTPGGWRMEMQTRPSG
jgi:hypothetical protein